MAILKVKSNCFSIIIANLKSFSRLRKIIFRTNHQYQSIDQFGWSGLQEKYCEGKQKVVCLVIHQVQDEHIVVEEVFHL